MKNLLNSVVQLEKDKQIQAIIYWLNLTKSYQERRFWNFINSKKLTFGFFLIWFIQTNLVSAVAKSFKICCLLRKWTSQNKTFSVNSD